MDADGAHQTRLTALPGSQNPNAWLPDGRIVYADWSAGKDTPEWYAMNTDRTNIVALPQFAGLNEPIDWLTLTASTPPWGPRWKRPAPPNQVQQEDIMIEHLVEDLTGAGSA